MSWTTGLLRFGALLTALCSANWGCVVVERGVDRPVLEVVLDEARTVKLMNYSVQNTFLPGERGNHAELSLVVDRGTSDASGKHVVAKRGGTFWWDVEPFRFGSLEGRADQTRDRIWVVDTEAGTVVASLDWRTGQTTGPDDEPPAWVSPTGGILLERVQPEPARRGGGAEKPTVPAGAAKPNDHRSEGPRVDPQSDAALRSLTDFLAHADSFRS
jgi:hypothetical protein